MRPVHRGTRVRWTTLPVTFPLRFSNSFMMIAQWSVVSCQLLCSMLLPTAYCLLPTAYCLLPTADCRLHHCIRPQALVFQLSIASFARIQGGSGIISMFESELT